jgi:hypothetical protein
MGPTKLPVDYPRIAWLFAAGYRHGEGFRFLEAEQNDAGFIFATELLADAGAWPEALPRYARIADAYRGVGSPRPYGARRHPSGDGISVHPRFRTGPASSRTRDRTNYKPLF